MAADRSVLFNNAGARMMEVGQLKIALDLFRGALESKLAFERSRRPNPPDTVLSIQRCVTPDCVSTAENHLIELDNYASVGEGSDGQHSQHRGQAAESPASLEIPVPVEGRGYSPYLVRKPFELGDSENDSTQLTSAVIVFNLGLVHQTANGNSPKTAAFYEISAALLSSEPDSPLSFLLRVALLNNFSVWCYDNGDGESLCTSIEHLASIMRHSSERLGPEVVHGVRSNLSWFLSPPNGASPAA